MHTCGRSINAARDIEDSRVRCKLARGDVASLSNVDTNFAGPFQQDLIELLAAYLIRLRPRDLSDVGEVNVAAAPSVMSVQARTPLLWKTCGLDPFGHAQSRERVVGSR
jgi:hypothetical protein